MLMAWWWCRRRPRTKAFERSLTRFEALGKLQRVVIDEVHLVLHCGETCPKPLLELDSLKRPCMPLLCMTATLSPPKEAYLSRRLDLYFTITFHSTATVATMRYTHEHVGSKRMDDRELLDTNVNQLSAKYLQVPHPAQGEHTQGQQPLRGIIFCSSVADVEKVYGHLRVNRDVQAYLYHAPKGKSDEERAAERSRLEAELANFRNAGASCTMQWLVATSATGVDLNVPKVQAVLIWGATHSFVDLIQMSGRAGRDL